MKIKSVWVKNRTSNLAKMSIFMHKYCLLKCVDTKKKCISKKDLVRVEVFCAIVRMVLHDDKEYVFVITCARCPWWRLQNLQEYLTKNDRYYGKYVCIIAKWLVWSETSELDSETNQKRSLNNIILYCILYF